jgi:hypothetical protein
VVGELHHLKRPEPEKYPRWLTIPDRGLYTGIAIFGAIGSGKKPAGARCGLALWTVTILTGVI